MDFITPSEKNHVCEVCGEPCGVRILNTRTGIHYGECCLEAMAQAQRFLHSHGTQCGIAHPTLGQFTQEENH